MAHATGKAMSAAMITNRAKFVDSSRKIVAGARRGSLNRMTSRKASSMLRQLVSMDSSRNCPISCRRRDPNVLRIPTSLALSIERAVERLIKLIPAILKINKAIKPKNHSPVRSPVLHFAL